MDKNSEPSEQSKLDPEKWVDQYADGLYRYALLRVGNPDIAEDLVQETFLAALTARDKFQGKASERTWLTAILRYKTVEYWRKNKHVQSSSDTEEQKDYFDKHRHWAAAPANWSGDPQQQLTKAEFWQVLQQCISKMGQTLSDAFFMREFEDISTETICKHLKISPEGLWSRLHRARLNLRHCLEKNWFLEPQESTEE